MDLEANDVIAALETQRNVALTQAAQFQAALAKATREIEQLKKGRANGNTDIPQPTASEDAGPIGVSA